MKKGYVYYDNVLAGTITQNDDGSFIFCYDDLYFANENSKPISLTLPKTEKQYESNILFPFFDGLIPEGYLLEIALKKYDLSNNDRMSLLLKTCRNPIGIVSVKEEIGVWVKFAYSAANL